MVKLRLFKDKELYINIVFSMMIILFLFQIFDVYATKLVIEGSDLKEQNPFMQKLMDSSENWALHSMALKSFAVFLFILLFFYLIKDDKFWEAKHLKYVVFYTTAFCFLLYFVVSLIHIYNISVFGAWGDLIV